MRRIKKSMFKGGAAGLILLLAVIRCSFPSVDDSTQFVAFDNGGSSDSIATVDTVNEFIDTVVVHIKHSVRCAKASGPVAPLGGAPQFGGAKHRIRSVRSFRDCFPDLQDTQIMAAQEWGVEPVENRAQAEQRMNELVFVGSNPYYTIDNTMTQSIPYLVPRAADLLQTIGRNFLDSLAIKHIPAHRIVVSSVLRTESDVRRLRRNNVNASENSCHRYGTTFDISYVRFSAVCPPGEERRTVRDDSLKYVLGEVLNDIRKAECCYIKHEVKQPCFHITVR